MIGNNRNINGQYRDNYQMRESHSETPDKKTATGPVQLSKYFSKKLSHPAPFHASKENQDPHLIAGYQTLPPQTSLYQHPKSTSSQHHISPITSIPVASKKSKKVIHLKSIPRNSRSQQKSNSMERRYNVEHLYTDTQVRAFDEVNSSMNHNANAEYYGSHQKQSPQPREAPGSKGKAIRNSKQKGPVVIQLDLYKHRRSVQDTLTSSSGLRWQQEAKQRNEARSHTNLAHEPVQTNRIQEHCDNHSQKAAIFMIKGRPYCKICAVKLITKGYVAVKIESTNCAQTETMRRQHTLQQFLQQLDKIQPTIEELSKQIQQYNSKWLKEYFQKQHSNLQENYQKSILLLQTHKKHTEDRLLDLQRKSREQFNQLANLVAEQASNVNFMRTDIMGNVEGIVDVKSISQAKFGQVMNCFKEDLWTISDCILQSSCMTISLPIVQELETHDLGVGLKSRRGIKDILDCLEKMMTVSEVTQQINLLQEEEQLRHQDNAINHRTLKGGMQFLEQLSSSPERPRGPTQAHHQTPTLPNYDTMETERNAQGSWQKNPHRLSFGKEMDFWPHSDLMSSSKKICAPSPTFKLI